MGQPCELPSSPFPSSSVRDIFDAINIAITVNSDWELKINIVVLWALFCENYIQAGISLLKSMLCVAFTQQNECLAQTNRFVLSLNMGGGITIPHVSFLGRTFKI